MGEAPNLELVRAIDGTRRGQLVELWRYGDEHLLISTVDLTEQQQDFNEWDHLSMNMGAAFGGYATNGEETMAFPCDENGEAEELSEIAGALGDGSRQRVIDHLRAVDCRGKRYAGYIGTEEA